MYLDFSDYTCVSSCSHQTYKPINASGFLMCRNYTYYVDTSSLSQIELGTFEYPFKKLVMPFRELFNFYIDEPSYSAVINIKENTTTMLYSIVEPLMIITAKNLTIKSYSQSGRSP
jgi:hypothetical protein